MDRWMDRTYLRTYPFPHSFIHSFIHSLTSPGGGSNTRATLAPSRLARSLRLTDVAWAGPSPPPPPPAAAAKNHKKKKKSPPPPPSAAAAASAKKKKTRNAPGCASPAERALRLALLEPLVAFVVGEVALPLLRAAFFVTEADGTGAWRGVCV